MKTYYVVCDFGKERYCRDKFERIILVTDNKDKAYSVCFDYRKQHRDNEIVVQRWYDNEVVDDLLWYVEFHFDTNKRCWKYDYSCFWIDWEDRSEDDEPGVYKVVDDEDNYFYVLCYAKGKEYAVPKALEMLEGYNEIKYK